MCDISATSPSILSVWQRILLLNYLPNQEKLNNNCNYPLLPTFPPQSVDIRKAQCENLGTRFPQHTFQHADGPKDSPFSFEPVLKIK